MSASRELLFGLLALQNNFVDRTSLVRAFDASTINKSKSLADYLVEQQSLDEAERRLIEALVDRFLARNGGDADRSLAALSTLDGVEVELEKFADPDLQASLLPAVRAHGLRQANSTDNDLQSTQSLRHSGAAAEGRFQILRPHAEGGLGRVYVARDRELNREVALKQIKDEHADNVESRSRFQLEAEITGRLEHPGIVPVYGLGSYDNGRPFYAMRFIRGQSLKEEIERFHGATPTDAGAAHAASTAISRLDVGERAVAFRKLLQRFIDVCEAVHYAHSRGVLHRDLKPGNVMVGRYGETLVVDWGLAKILGTDTPQGSIETLIVPSSGSGATPTVMGSAVGTPAYMSPEQAAGKLDALGPASDVYSLGAMLYAVMTRRAPFNVPQREGGMGELLAHVQRGEFVKPREINPFIPKPLEAICLRAMALAPTDRYATARDLATEVERFLADEPVIALQESPLSRVGRFGRKNRGYVRAGVISLAVVSVVSIVAGVRINEQKRLAEQSADEERRAKNRANELADEKSRLAEEKTQLAGLERAAREEADRQLRSATAQRLAAQALSARTDNPARAGALAIEAVNVTRRKGEGVVPQARAALYEVADSLGGALVTAGGGAIKRLALSPDGRWLAAAIEADIRLWRVDGLESAHDGQLMMTSTGDSSADFSPNGHWLAATTAEGGESWLYVWDANSPDFPNVAPRKLRFPQPLNAPPVFGFSEAHLFFRRGADHLIEVWNLDVEDPATSAVTLTVMGTPVVPAEGSWFAGWMYEQKGSALQRWDRKAGAETVVVQDGGVGAFSRWTGPVVSRNGRRLVLPELSRDVVWDLQSEQPESPRVRSRERAPLTTIKAFAVSPDGRWWATASNRGDLHVRDLDAEDDNDATRLLARNAGKPARVEFSQNGRWLAWGLDRGAVEVWEAPAFGKSSTLSGHSASVNNLAFTADGERLYTGSQDGTIRRWDLASADVQRSRRVAPLDYPVAVINASFSPDGRWLAQVSRRMMLVDLSQSLGALQVHRLKTYLHANFVFSPDSRWLARITSEPEAQVTYRFLDVVDLSASPLSETGQPLHPEFPIGSVAFSPDGKKLAAIQSVQSSPGVQLWQLSTSEFKSRLLTPATNATEFRLNPTTFAPDGQALLIGASDGSLRIFDINDRGPKTSSRRLAAHQADVVALESSTSRRLIVSAAADGSVQLLDWPSEKLRPVLPAGAALNPGCLTLSPSGKWLAIHNSLAQTLLLDLDKVQEQPPLVLEGHSAVVSSATFSGDERWLATCDQSAVHLWDLTADRPADTHQELHSGTSTFRKIAISSDNEWLFALTTEGTLRRWELNLDQLIAQVQESAKKASPTESNGLPTVEPLAASDRSHRELLNWHKTGVVLMNPSNHQFSIAALRQWQQNMEAAMAAQQQSPTADQAGALRLAEKQLEESTEILRLVQLDGSEFQQLPARVKRRIIPLRLQVALEDRRLETVQSLLRELEFLAEGWTDQLDCASWSAFAAKKVKPAGQGEPSPSAELYEWCCDNAIRLLKKSRQVGTRPSPNWFAAGANTPLYFDLDVLKERPDLHEVVEGARRHDLSFNWRIHFFGWPGDGPRNPPTDWKSVIAAEPLETAQSSVLRFHWDVKAPAKNVPADHFAVVATTEFDAAEGDYQFELVSDDGIRMVLDDRIIVDQWRWRPITKSRVQVRLSQGIHRLRIEYFEIDGNATLDCIGYATGRSARTEPFTPLGAEAAAFDLACVRTSGEIFIVHAANKRPTSISLPGPTPRHIDWAADGSVLYAQLGHQVVAVNPLMPDELRTLVEFESPPALATVSPRGDQVAVLDMVSGRPIPRHRVVNVADRAERILSPFGYDPCWSADGGTLAALHWQGAWKMAIFDVESLELVPAGTAGQGSPPTPKVLDSPPFHPTLSVYPALSPDGQSVAFAMKGDNGLRQIGILSRADGSVRQVTKNNVYNMMPAFSPDGRFVSYLRGAAAPFEVAVIDLQSGNETVITRDAVPARPTWRRRLPPEK